MLIALGIMFTFGTADAQNLLKKIGKAVEKTVKEEFTEKVSKEADKLLHKGNEKQQQKQENGDQHSKNSIPAKAVSVDKGQNIAQEEGWDYIDEWGINHGGGILIDDVVWAPVNCGYHETDFPYGKLYQWGRKHGQGYGAPYAREDSNVSPDKTTAEIVPAPVTPAEARKHHNRFYARSENASFNWTKNDMYLWIHYTEDFTIIKKEENDPCPKGWRVAVDHDFHNLIKNHSEMVEGHNGGQIGMWFSGSKPYSTNVPRIFLPAAGIRYSNGECYGRNKIGLYWTNRHGGGEAMVWHLDFSRNGADVPPTAYPHDAYSVRCVKDVKGQKMH